MLRSIDIEHLARQHFEIPFWATMSAAQIASIKVDHDCGSHCVNIGIRRSLGTQSRDMLADTAGSIAHRAGIDGAPDGQQLGQQISHLSKRRERGEFGGDVGEFGRYAAFKRQRRKTSRFTRDFTAALAVREPTNSKRHVAEEGSKGDRSVSFARQGRSAMCAAPEALAHRRRLRADDFRLNSSGKAFPFAKRQTKRFRDRELVSGPPRPRFPPLRPRSPRQASPAKPAFA